MTQRTLFCMLLLLATLSAAARKLKSPNGRLTLSVLCDENRSTDTQGLQLCYNGRPVLEIPVLGYVGEPCNAALRFSAGRKVRADYRMPSGKRLHCTNRANEYEAALSPELTLRVRLYDDGLAFRYELRELSGRQLPEEQTAYRIADGTRRWMMKWSYGYEDFYPLATVATDGRWGFPALLEPADDTFVLLTEANIERRQSAASLHSRGELFRVVPDRNDLNLSGPWHSPWRLAIVGSLADVVESTLVTDVSEPAATDDTWIKPGVASWVYWAYNHGSNDYDIIRRYTDMAATLHLPYVLIDAEWDEMKNGKSIEDAVRYANEKGVRPMIWYNSTTGWIHGAPGPKHRLNKPEDREREFAWCERLGVAGVKIDFFEGDKETDMGYCIDLLESAARHRLLVNFHGATIPRGWQRTYPNLLSTEAVYGAEWYNNLPVFTERAAMHNATLPFTRNVIGPMDYTPCAFSDSQHPHITTHAHELALTVLYESGLQHLADRPESLLAQPRAVQDFFSQLPAAWDETRLVCGYPGEMVVIARRSGTTWYVAGINGGNPQKCHAGADERIITGGDLRYGDEEPRDFDLSGLRHIVGKGLRADCFLDGDEDRAWQLLTDIPVPQTVHCRPRGGFVLVLKK